ncbi:nucleoside-diphosphate kinase [candidate division KSB1 bacterium]
MSRTLAILKPDCTGRGLIGEVVSHLEKKGFKIICAKMVLMKREIAEGFYAIHKERSFFNNLMDFMTSGRVLVMVLESDDAVNKLREVIGATDPEDAEEGTIRKIYAENKQNNIIHASDSEENAGKEIRYFFSTKELIENEI